MPKLYLIDPGPRPPYQEVGQQLWGDGDFDSDGDSSAPGATDWTELTISLRPECVERIDIDPVSTPGRLVLCVSSESEDLVRRTGEFLAQRTGGSLATAWGAECG